MVRDLIDNMILPTIRDLLNAEDPPTPQPILEQVIMVYGNIVGEEVEFRDNVISQNVIPPIVRILSESENGSTMMQNATWCLVSFLKGDPAPQTKFTEQMIPTLIETLLRTDMDKVMGHVLAGLNLFF